MTIAENQKTGNGEKKGGFFTPEELDLLDIPESGAETAQKDGKMNASQSMVVILLLTAIASFALGMLAEHGIESSQNGVVGQGGVQQGVGVPSFAPANSASK